MTNKQNEFMIGLSMTIAILVVVFSVLWLGKSNFFVKGVTLNLLVENANGIATGEEVFYRGLKVGSVLDAKVTADNILLKLKVEGVDKIPRDSKFEIRDFTMISGKVVEIIPGTSNIFLQSGDTVKGFVAYGLNNLVNDLKDLKPKIIQVLSNLDTLTGGKFQNKLNSSLTNLNGAINQLRTLFDGDLKSTLANIDEITYKNKSNIFDLIKSLKLNSEELSLLLRTFSKTSVRLDSLFLNINNGKGSLGQLIQNDSLFNNLNHTIISLDSLLTDLKNNPDKYINVSVF